MAQLGQFIINHWALWLALLLILLLIYVNELLARKKQAKSVSPQALVQLMNHEHAVVVDLRDADAFRSGHIIGAVRVTADAFKQQQMDKYKTSTLVLVCAKGILSASLAAQLQKEGFAKPFVLAGGMGAWQSADLPVIKGK
ncbi:MAG: rhodanese-like domain-containing protein [Tatlockia sp.]|jgi:rhodanese-related sulfurtransferase